MPSLVERLLALDSCAVSDALDKLSLSGAVSGLRPASSTRRIVGFVASSEVERALEAAEAIARRERAMAQALKVGKAVSQVMGADYEHMRHP
jgi:hypothetical protein